MKTILKAFLAIVVVVLLVWIFSAGDSDMADIELDDGEGEVYVSITDDTADISSVKEITMEVESIEMYSQAKGWTRVSSNSEEYPLLALKANGSLKLYGANAVDAGAYERLRLTLGEVVVDHTTQGNVEAFIPSETVTFDVNVVVGEGESTHVTLDFLADQSLHTTVDGEFVFAPVVEVESRSGASVEVGEDKEVTVSGGQVDTQVTVGVDLAGEARAGFKLNSSAGLEVDSSAVGGTQFMLGGEVVTSNDSSDEESSDGAESSEDTSDGTSSSAESSSNTEASSGGTEASVETETETNVNLGY